MKGQFKPGVSGNPRGRPKGIKDRRVSLRELLQPHAGDLIGQAIGMALAGDVTALRICMDRIVPPIKEEFVNVTLPKIDSSEDCTRAQAAIIQALASGEMLPSEARLLSELIDHQRQAYETGELTKRLASVEDQLKRDKKL